MAFKFSQRSMNNLEGVHEDLVRVVKRALEITEIDFMVLEGLRSVTRQAELVKSGASTTMNSRHLSGKAVDLVALVGGKVTWQPKIYDKIAKAMKQAAKELSVPIVHGGDWETFKDLVHFELSRKFYP